MSGDSMSSFITTLSSSLSSSNLWAEASNAISLIAGMAIFVFGYSLVRKIIKGASKGKFRM